jgi:hypothetical protein
MLRLIPIPQTQPRWLLSPKEHRKLAAQLRAKNPASRAAELHITAALVKERKLLRLWLAQIAQSV